MRSGPVSTRGSAAPGARRRWGFRLLAITLVPLLVLGLLEGGLRLLGVGYPTGFFLRDRRGGEAVWVENDRFGWRFFPPELARTPGLLSLPVGKGSRTFRVFVLGESAALGDPDPAAGFGRFLEVLLAARHPTVRFEVVNVSMTAINSHAIREIARDCAGREADLWVVYMGNNEVVGPYGAGTIFGSQAPPLGGVRAGLALKTTRVGQALDLLVRRVAHREHAGRTWGGLEMFTAQTLRTDDPKLATVRRHFARNLEDILDLGTRAGARVLLSSVAVNLRDCPPFASPPRAGISDGERRRWESGWERGRSLAAQGRELEAVAALAEAATVDDQHAELHFLWAECLRRLGRSAEARARFEQARDLDALRVRADGAINATIRRVAERRPGTGMRLVDAAEQLARASAGGVPGSEWFHDHVHLNEAGNFELARLFAAEVEALFPEGLSGVRATGPWLSREECADRLGLTAPDRLETLEAMRRRLAHPPFTHQAGHADRYRVLGDSVRQLRGSVTPAALTNAVVMIETALRARGDDLWLHERLARARARTGDFPGAIVALRRVVADHGRSAETWLGLGTLLLRRGEWEEAEQVLRRSLALQPGSAEGLDALGQVLAGRGRLSEAVECHLGALARRRNYPEAHLHLGLAYLQLGRQAEAAVEFGQALRLDPNSAEASLQLARLRNADGSLARAVERGLEAVRRNPADPALHFELGEAWRHLGSPEQARAEYDETLRLDPGSAPAHFQVGYDLARRGDDLGAIRHFGEAVRLDPGFADAHLNYGVALARQQRYGEAIVAFETVLRLQPDSAAARQFLDLARARQGVR